jgi:hypothetical protein
MAQPNPNPDFRRRLPPAGALLLVLWAWTAVCAGQAPRVPEAAKPDALFAAFTYNFCLFTTWPERKPPARKDSLVILVAGDRIPALSVLNGRSVHRRPITVHSLPPAAELPDTCDVLICNGLRAERRDTLLAAAAERPILTMSRDPGFCAAGGIVEFFLEDRKVRFRVSCRNMKRSGIRVQSRLLKLAVIVPPTARGD